jgi:hypothetical protein
MTATRYRLDARISSDDPAAIRPVLERLFARGSISAEESTGEFAVRAELEGESARELNRALLSELRRAEKRTRLRAEWTASGTTERFFDYVPKGQRKSPGDPSR